MAQGKKPSKWRRLPKMSFSSKDMAKRMKRVEGASVKHAHRFVVKRWSSFKEARRHIALWALVIGVIIGATGLQILWYQQSYRTTANASSGTYAEGVMGPVETLNPIFASSSAEQSASRLLFSRLLTYDKTGTLNYDLADRMTLSDDSRTYTVRIRADAQWHDGRFVRADDVIYTVNLLKNGATRSTITGWGDIKVTALDERTVEFRLPAVYAPFPHALSALPILPEHVLRDVEPSALRENKFSRAPIGSGPFTIRFVQDLGQGGVRKVLHLARNETYYRGAPKLERFQLHVYDTSDALVRGLNTSEVNAATDVNVADSKSLSEERYTIDRHPVSSGVYALFNTTGGVLNDAKVRQALQVGTDTAALRKAVGPGTPELHLPFIQNQVDGDLPTAPKFDLKRAAQLLDDAGWKLEGSSRKKGDTELKVRLVTTKNPDFEVALEELQKQWRSLGVTVTTRIVDPSDRSQNVSKDILQPRDYDVLVYRLEIGGDPDVYAYWHSSQANRGLNFSNYSNGVSDEALSSARTVTAKNLRDAKYVTFARQWLSDAPAIGLFQNTSQYVYSEAVHGQQKGNITVFPADRYNDVLYWSVGDRVVYRTP